MALVQWEEGSEGEVCLLRSPGIAASPISFCLWEESVGGAEQRGKFSSLEGKHDPSI